MSFLLHAAGVCRGDRPRLDVRLVAELHDRTSGPRLGHAAALVGTANARPANVVVHQELAGRGRVVGPPALECAIVVAIFGNRVVVDDRPVGRVDEQRLGVVGHIRGRQQWGGQPSVGVGTAESVALLDGVAAAERRLSAVVRQFATDIEVLLQNQHIGAQVMGAFRRHDSGPTGAAHDHIRLVVPANVSGGPLCLCLARGRQDGRAQSGGSARLDEVAPAGGRLIPKLGDLCFAFFDHDKFPSG